MRYRAQISFSLRIPFGEPSGAFPLISGLSTHMAHWKSKMSSIAEALVTVGFSIYATQVEPERVR